LQKYAYSYIHKNTNLANQQSTSNQELLPQQQNTTSATAAADELPPQATVNTDYAMFRLPTYRTFDVGFQLMTVTSISYCNAISANVRFIL